ncbi:hypothetical protein ABEW03_16085 [Virgibacillus pantothenticus]|uniref:hypothetical protein n=1 Tax=Virgibacillus pantothenticus TaxID=1473 RepID=UPI003D29A61A
MKKQWVLNYYEHQQNYLLDKGNLKGGRATGKTVAYCIKLALSNGEPLNLNKPEEFSDFGDGSVRYARYFFKGEFLKIRNMLKKHGFPVREVKGISKGV